MSIFTSHKECWVCGELGHKRDMVRKVWRVVCGCGGSDVIYMHKQCKEYMDKNPNGPFPPDKTKGENIKC